MNTLLKTFKYFFQQKASEVWEIIVDYFKGVFRSCDEWYEYIWSFGMHFLLVPLSFFLCIGVIHQIVLCVQSSGVNTPTSILLAIGGVGLFASLILLITVSFIIWMVLALKKFVLWIVDNWRMAYERARSEK